MTLVDSVAQVDFEALFDLAPNPYLLLTPDRIITGVNQVYLRMLGYEAEELIGVEFFAAFPGDSISHQQLHASFTRVLAAKTTDTLESIRYPLQRKSADGWVREDHYWSATNTPILNKDGEVAFILNNPVDITGLITSAPVESRTGKTDRIREGFYRNALAVQTLNERLDDKRRHLRLLFENAPGFICILQGPDLVFELANAAYYQLVGHQQILGKPMSEALPELQGQGFLEMLAQVYATGKPFVDHATSVWFQSQPGSPPQEKYVDFVCQPIIEANGTTTGIFVQGHDVSEAHQLTQEVRHHAAHDALTGLANRRTFERRLRLATEQTSHSQVEHSLLYLDLDQFKVMNDTCGHMAGDEFLRCVSDTLRKHVRAADTLARLGGDEFALLLESCPGEAAHRIANEVRQSIAKIEFSWLRRRLSTTVSIGLVTIKGQSLSFEEVLSTADSACYLAKEKGRNRLHVYHPDDAELTARRREMDWVGRLREALDDERLVLYAQQIAPINQQPCDFDRCEVLVRLQEKDGTLVPPMAFIPAAERYNLMPTIDRYIIRSVFRHLQGLPDKMRARASYSINLSGTSLNDEGFLAFVKTQLVEYAIAAHQICFEVTETAAVANFSYTVNLITSLKELGFQFALDDFGSGMSSFGYLKQLPVDFVKIDGAFVKDILNNPVDCAMVEAIARVARVMGIATVAEYVENKIVLARLAAMGVDFGQGYGIHKPEPLAAWTKTLCAQGQRRTLSTAPLEQIEG